MPFYAILTEAISQAHWVEGGAPGNVDQRSPSPHQSPRVPRGFTPQVRQIFRAMQRYGLIVADNGSDMYVERGYRPPALAPPTNLRIVTP